MSIFRLGKWRGLVGLVAAYALALQALFGGIILAKAAQADPFEICLAGDSGADHSGPGKATPHQNCILCSLAHQPALPDGPATIAAPLRLAGAVRLSRPDQAQRTRVFRRDHYQRGPPAFASA